MRYLIFLSLLLFGLSIDAQRATRGRLILADDYKQELSTPNDSCNNMYVYICTGKSSECYHSSPACRGLKNCSQSIDSIKVSEISESRRKCKICFRSNRRR